MHVMWRIVLQLALAADVDPRTARKAMREGAAAVRGRPGERIAEQARILGIALPYTSTSRASEPPTAA